MFILKWPSPASFCLLSVFFKQILQFLQQINVKNIHPAGIWCWDLNPPPVEQESPPKATEAGYLHFLKLTLSAPR